MKKRSVLLLATVVSLSLVFCADNVSATSMAYSLVEFTSDLSYTLGAGITDISFTPQQIEASTNVSNGIGEADSDLDNTIAEASSSVTNASAQAWAEPGRALPNPYGKASASADAFVPSASAFAGSSLPFQITVEGEGLITFMINYHVQLSLNTDNAGDTAGGSAQAGLTLFIEGQGASGVPYILEEQVSDGGSGSWEHTGTLEVTGFFSDSSFLYYEVYPTTFLDINAASSGTVPVPEPSTLLLIGTGLLGIVGFKRKSKS